MSKQIIAAHRAEVVQAGGVLAANGELPQHEHKTITLTFHLTT
jgi:hypothetical protein